MFVRVLSECVWCVCMFVCLRVRARVCECVRLCVSVCAPVCEHRYACVLSQSAVRRGPLTCDRFLAQRTSVNEAQPF